MNALNRATKMANRLPVASSFPSTTGNSASATSSIFNLSFFVIFVPLEVNCFDP
jgi:hypothetical protein